MADHGCVREEKQRFSDQRAEGGNSEAENSPVKTVQLHEAHATTRNS
jgi:hypothetical protein